MRKEKMWIYLSVGFISMLILLKYRRSLGGYYKKLSFVLSIFAKSAVYQLAEKYDFISGQKDIAENLNVAKVSYRNLRNQICIVNVPFIKQNVRIMKDKIVVLEKEGENGKIKYLNITQEPGMVYLLSPFELGGKRISVYESQNGWYDKEFKVGGKPLLTVEKNEKLPAVLSFEKKEEEILF